MRILGQTEVEGLVAKGKDAPEQKITAILNDLEREHPAVYRLIYGEPSDAIAAINKDMANLYLDLAFDVVWVFLEAFGKPPKIANEEGWVSQRLAMIDAELKSLAPEVKMDHKLRTKLRERFANNSFASGIQLVLLQHLQGEVAKYASFKRRRAAAAQLTNNLLFVLVRLIGDLYNTKLTKSA